jgi:hypothetical protein
MTKEVIKWPGSEKATTKRDVDLIHLLEHSPTSNKEIASYETNYKIDGTYDSTTLELIVPYNNAHNFFKKHLFKDLLSGVVLAFNRNVKSAGYYRPIGYVTSDSIIIPEININPDRLFLPPEIVMSTLVHEQCHHFQCLHGSPGRGKYHNKQFADLMEYMGLMCSDTGLPGGKKTGERMTHYIIEGGRFQQVFSALPDECKIPFSTIPTRRFHNRNTTRVTPTVENDRNKTKFVCPICGCAAWGKPSLHISCDDCYTQMLRV